MAQRNKRKVKNSVLDDSSKLKPGRGRPRKQQINMEMNATSSTIPNLTTNLLHIEFKKRTMKEEQGQYEIEDSLINFDIALNIFSKNEENQDESNKNSVQIIV